MSNNQPFEVNDAEINPQRPNIGGLFPEKEVPPDGDTKPVKKKKAEE